MEELETTQREMKITVALHIETMYVPLVTTEVAKIKSI